MLKFLTKFYDFIRFFHYVGVCFNSTPDWEPLIMPLEIMLSSTWPNRTTAAVALSECVLPG